MVWRDHYPFAANFVELEGGQRLHYVDQGSGPVLLLSHGNPTWSFYYRHLIQAWSTNYRVIAVDHLGCGLSDKPQKYDYCLVKHTDNLLSVAEALRLSDVTIVGHDWGGAIGLNAVRRSPDRFARIVMFNTGAFPPAKVPWRIAACRVPLLGALAVRGANVFARAALFMATSDRTQMSDDERQGMVAPYDSWSNRVAIQRFVDDIPLTKRHRTWSELQALESALPRMSGLPVLLVWGLQDWCFDNACLERFTRAWPHADVLRIENAGHWVVEDAAARIVPAVERFLEAHPIKTAKNADDPAAIS